MSQEIEKKIKVLLIGQLKAWQFPGKTITKWFSQAYKYLVNKEDYERAAKVKKIEDEFKLQ